MSPPTTPAAEEQKPDMALAVIRYPHPHVCTDSDEFLSYTDAAMKKLGALGRRKVFPVTNGANNYSMNGSLQDLPAEAKESLALVKVLSEEDEDPFVMVLRAKATEGARKFDTGYYCAGSTKSALALTRVAFDSGVKAAKAKKIQRGYFVGGVAEFIDELLAERAALKEEVMALREQAEVLVEALATAPGFDKAVTFSPR
ncbi:uncharacterized protein K452DRAFT_338515 [Aplosporella prunicola CBS 121167]|uniref:Uncharacterized protein n=1 Tax=Aplosporella prunicola CBS 121167 TaxID=1176127 RepID=A0A6A6B5C0_9PEZI|nr:uncharacterized protein K452DRAFT_338515 [Aplosporella prunicola CBS 121167]KAF2138465.1 hypothetical protein K452DRAFT_338515 [Aplosporella prunicola CBS 121167]